MTTAFAELVAAAQAARQRAYAPYSHYAVGAALLTAEGEVFIGCNIENASYPATCCAEQVAIHSAVAAGARAFTAIAVATSNGGSPCGVCRQVMREFAPDLIILIVDEQGAVRRTTMAEMLPDSFGPEHLPARGSL